MADPLIDVLSEAMPVSPQAGGEEALIRALTPAQIARQIQRRAMAGLEPTPEQMQWLQSQMPAKEARGEALGALGAELTGIPQMGRAASGISEAVTDPSIANVTNAGMHTALAALRPMTALKTLGAGYGAALADDLGMFGTEAEAQQAKKKGPPPSSLPGVPPELNAEHAALKKRVADDAFDNMTDKRAAVQRMRDIENLSNQHVARGSTSAQDEYNRAVKRAEDALAAEMKRNTRFTDTTTGQLYNKTAGFTPGLLAFGSGALTRAAMKPSNLSNYYLPGAMGVGEGIVAANVPLAADAYLGTAPADNPLKAGYEAGARELPPNHPRRQEWLDNASRMPDANPVRTLAAAELYDPMKLAERSGIGALEGLVGGLLGAKASALGGRIGEGVKDAAGRLREALSGPAPHPGPTPGPTGGTPSGGGLPSTMPTAGAAPSGDILPPSPGALEGALSAPPARLPAPAASPNLLSETLAKAPVANRNVPKAKDAKPGVDKLGRPYHKDPDDGRFISKPDGD